MLLILAMLITVPEGNVYHDGVQISVDEMVDELREADVVFIGEKHDDPLAHEWELFIWRELADDGRALALEMFETDVQELLDGYLDGLVTEEDFLAGSRPWGNYSTDYAPLVALAIENGNHVIAANVPRAFAAQVASGGWEAIEEEEFFQNLVVDSSSVLYRDKFLATIEMMGDAMHGMAMNHMDIYRAQLLKDAVMAGSISDTDCLFVCGSFHSDDHSGIIDQMDGERSILTVTILPEDEELRQDIADYVVAR